MSGPFFISGTEVTLEFGDDFLELHPNCAYVYFLNRMLFAPSDILRVAFFEDADGPVDMARLEQSLGRERGLEEFKASASTNSSDDLLAGLIEDEGALPQEFFNAVARLPEKFGKSAFLTCSCGDHDAYLRVVAYCVSSLEEELAEMLKGYFSAVDYRLKGGIRSGLHPIASDTSFLEELGVVIDPETHVHPDDGEPFDLLTDAFDALESGDFVLAAELYRDPDLVRNFPEALLGLGVALDAQGKFEEAVQCTREFIARAEMLPEDAYQREELPKAFTNLACSLYSLGLLQEARVEVTRALELAPADEEALEILEMINTFEAAPPTGRETDVHPDDAGYIERLDDALVAFESGDFVRAAELYRDPDLVRNFPEALLGLGAALDAQGKFEEAVQCTREFIAMAEMLPEDAYQREELPKAFTNLACSLYSLGLLQEARAEVTRALELAPADEEALEILEIIESDLLSR